MWKELSQEKKDKYRRLITNFASLSKAFAQKDDKSSDTISPIVNSKFQETAFKKSFGAFIEDIGNTSYDASVDDGDKKYLVGIKIFGINSGDQKIAQFKSESREWHSIFKIIEKNNSKAKNKEESDKLNEKYYLEIAKKIASSRNHRIKESKKKLQGFDYEMANNVSEVEAVYHVIMPSSKGEQPAVSVGETSYTEIDIDSLQIDGCTTYKNPANFIFHDNNHVYKYTYSDSQLYMKFDNQDIVLETWPVDYIDNAIEFFENLDEK